MAATPNAADLSSASPLCGRPVTVLLIDDQAIVGELLVFTRFAPECLWLLPGLWSIFFGLGIFASSRFLPPAILWIDVFYLAAGLICLAFLAWVHWCFVRGGTQG